MRLYRRAAAAAVALVMAAPLASACVSREEAEQEALNFAASQLRTTLENQGFRDVQVTIEDETETVTVMVAPPAAKATPKPSGSTSASPKPAANAGKVIPTPTASTVQVRVLSAVVTLPGLPGKECKANIEKKLRTFQDTSPPYFDEVITPDAPDGIEVEGEARSDISPKGTLGYITRVHGKQCLPSMSNGTPIS